MRSRWSTPRAVSAHVALALCEPGFAALCWWQIHRALDGNDLSWMYVFEWPFFGAYALVLWWRIVRDQRELEQAPSQGEARGEIGAPTTASTAAGVTAAATRPSPWRERARTLRARLGVEDAEARRLREQRQLEAYNRYLAALRDRERAGSPDLPETRR